MSISADDIFKEISGAARSAFKEAWTVVEDYAPAEFRKMAIQLESIVENVTAFELDNKKGYSVATAKILFRMQRRASESVLIAVTQLTLIAVEKALNSIIKVIKEAFGASLAKVL